jgi:hypothetical protein
MKRKRITQVLSKRKSQFAGYPKYPSSEDIYEKEKKAVPAKSSDPLIPITENGKIENVPEFTNESNINLSDYPLDVPGSDLDDNMEDIGSEDEENNYYSIGGDNHTNL